jgi:hypothetical protein
MLGTAKVAFGASGSSGSVRDRRGSIIDGLERVEVGITRGTARLLMTLSAENLIRGRVLMLGRLSLDVTPYELKKLARKVGIAKCVSSVANTEDLLLALGADSVESLDLSQFEGASIAHDLNLLTPEHLDARFDLLLNLGTLEHIFDVRTALRNTWRVLALDGIVVHSLPANNQMEHGFYQFSPTLLLDYMYANHWSVLEALVLQYPGVNSRHWTVIGYEPSVFAARQGGAWSSRPMSLWFVARKTAVTTEDAIPQQRMYRDAWHAAGDAEADSGFTPSTCTQTEPQVSTGASFIASPILQRIAQLRTVRRLRYRPRVKTRRH